MNVADLPLLNFQGLFWRYHSSGYPVLIWDSEIGAGFQCPILERFLKFLEKVLYAG